MTELVLDRYEYASLQRQRVARAMRNNVPRRWLDVIDALSIRFSGHPAGSFRFRSVACNRAKLFTWIPSVEALLTALWGRGLVYLCWGGIGRSGLKGIAERTILRRAEYLLVNDAVTQREIECLVGRSSIMIPYVVDTDFFTFAGHDERGDFLFCSNVNDRDPSVLLALAKAGHKVVWTVDDGTLRSPYAKSHSNLRLIPHVPFPELRRLYHTCRAYVMPLRRDVGAAGQTTIMEALSCGTPVVTSAGRTADIFSDIPAVTIARSAAVEEWLASVSCAGASKDTELRARKSRELVEQQWSFDQVLERLCKLFSDYQLATEAKCTTTRTGSQSGWRRDVEILR